MRTLFCCRQEFRQQWERSIPCNQCKQWIHTYNAYLETIAKLCDVLLEQSKGVRCVDTKTIQEEHTRKLLKGRYDNHVCFTVTPNPNEKWGEILDVQVSGERNLKEIKTDIVPEGWC